MDHGYIPSVDSRHMAHAVADCDLVLQPLELRKVLLDAVVHLQDSAVDGNHDRAPSQSLRHGEYGEDGVWPHRHLVLGVSPAEAVPRLVVVRIRQYAHHASNLAAVDVWRQRPPHLRGRRASRAAEQSRQQRQNRELRNFHFSSFATNSYHFSAPSGKHVGTKLPTVGRVRKKALL